MTWERVRSEIRYLRMLGLLTRSYKRRLRACAFLRAMKRARNA